MTAQPTSTVDETATLAAAFRLLLEDGRKAPAERLAATAGSDVGSVEQSLEALERQGRVTRDECGCVHGAAGLSVVPTEHELEVAGRRLWAWCAKTALGTLGALGLGGVVRSRCPVTGGRLELPFERAAPAATDWVVLWPDERFTSGCSSAADELCPNISFFASPEAARAWAGDRDVTGEVLSVSEATARAADDWAVTINVASLRDSLAEEVAAAER
jgi:alkylmercury lyase